MKKLFQPGKSGNPTGRPAGSGDQIRHVRKTLNPHLSQIAETVLADALNGNVQSAAAILNFYGQSAR